MVVVPASGNESMVPYLMTVSIARNIAEKEAADAYEAVSGEPRSISEPPPPSKRGRGVV